VSEYNHPTFDGYVAVEFGSFT